MPHAMAEGQNATDGSQTASITMIAQIAMSRKCEIALTDCQAEFTMWSQWRVCIEWKKNTKSRSAMAAPDAAAAVWDAAADAAAATEVSEEVMAALAAACTQLIDLNVAASWAQIITNIL